MVYLDRTKLRHVLIVFKEDKMDRLDKKKLGFIIGAAVAGITVIVLILCFVLSGNNRDYTKYYDEAEMAFISGDYDKAIERLEKAMDIEPTEECYLLMAEIYYVQDDLSMAIQILNLGASRLNSDAIDKRLAELKAEKNEDVIPLPDASPNGGISVGGKEIAPDTRSLLLSEMGLADGDIAALAALSGLESLSLADNSLTDISPLAGLTGLNFLQINGNSISDLSPLANLTGLKTLYIDGNPIADFTPLHGLNALRTLSMKGVNITESQLKALQEALPDCKIFADTIEEEILEITLGGKTFTSDVTELDLRGLGITDISPLSQCTELVKLDLRDNSITDLAPLVDLQKLEYLSIWNNKVSDLGPLMSLAELKYLDADNNKLTNITVLEYLPKMEELWLSGNDLDSIKVLEKLPALRRLGLKSIGLTDADLEMLGGIKTLTELVIENNPDLSANAMDELKQALPNCKITHSELLYVVKLGDTEFKSDATSITASGMGISDISGLEHFTALKTLILSSNSISDISPLASCKDLEVLELYGNHISELAPLSGLTKLRSLSLLNNSVSNIAPLANMTGLTELYLSFNAIGDISALGSLASLQDLNLDGNVIKDISVLSKLTALKNLSLEDNLIEDLTPLFKLSGLQTLYLRGNPDLTIEQVYQLQQALPNCIITSDFDLTAYPPASPEPDEAPSREEEDEPDEAENVRVPIT